MRIYVDRKDSTIDAICRKVGYSGRKVSIKAQESVTLSNTYWSGGSRSTYYGLNLETLQTVDLPHFSPPQFGGPSQPLEIPLVENLMVIEHDMFQGKDMGLILYIHPVNAAPLLPKSSELTPEETIVLEYTARLKPSYNGISNLRFHTANQEKGITSEQWETAKTALIAKKLLNKAGAITPEGRNARQANPVSRFGG